MSRTGGEMRRKTVSVLLPILTLAAGPVLAQQAPSDPTQEAYSPSEPVVAGAIAYTQRKPAPFYAMTASKGGFAVLGVAASYGAGKHLLTTNGIDDPASGIAVVLARSLASNLSTQVAAGPIMADGEKPAQIAAAAGSAQYVVDVQTLGWGYHYYSVDWTHFSFGYRARFRLIDAASRAVVVDDVCDWGTDKATDLPTHSDLIDNGAAGLKARLAKATMACTDQFSRTLSNSEPPPKA